MDLYFSTSPVIKNKEILEPLAKVYVPDILCFEFDNCCKMVVFHTLVNQYFAPGTLIYWQQSLKATGYDFPLLDRTNAVNLERLRSMNAFKHEGYFEDVVTKESKKCRISHLNLDYVSAYLSRTANEYCFG